MIAQGGHVTPSIESNPLTACTRIGILRFRDASERSQKHRKHNGLQSFKQLSCKVEMHKSVEGHGSGYPMGLRQDSIPRVSSALIARFGRIGSHESQDRWNDKRILATLTLDDGRSSWAGAPTFAASSKSTVDCTLVRGPLSPILAAGRAQPRTATEGQLVPASELVRKKIREIARGCTGADTSVIPADPAPSMERTFHHVDMLTTPKTQRTDPAAGAATRWIIRSRPPGILDAGLREARPIGGGSRGAGHRYAGKDRQGHAGDCRAAASGWRTRPAPQCGRKK